MLKRPFAGMFPVSQMWGVNKNVYAWLDLLGHNGVDYATPVGTPILAPHDGIVREVAFDANGYGYYIKIENSSEGSILAHLSRQDVKVGDAVKQHQRVGLSGNSGWSTGPHLHWGYYRFPRDKSNGFSGTIDPWPYLNAAEQKVQEPAPATIQPILDQRPYWFDLWNKEVTGEGWEKLSTEEVKRIAAEIKNRALRAALWDQLCKRAGITKTSSQVTVEELFNTIAQIVNEDYNEAKKTASKVPQIKETLTNLLKII